MAWFKTGKGSVKLYLLGYRCFIIYIILKIFLQVPMYLANIDGTDFLTILNSSDAMHYSD